MCSAISNLKEKSRGGSLFPHPHLPHTPHFSLLPLLATHFKIARLKSRFPFFPEILQRIPIWLPTTTTPTSSTLELLSSRSTATLVLPNPVDMSVWFLLSLRSIWHSGPLSPWNTVPLASTIQHTLCSSCLSFLTAWATSLHQLDVGLPWYPFPHFPFPGTHIPSHDSNSTHTSTALTFVLLA